MGKVLFAAVPAIAIVLCAMAASAHQDATPEAASAQPNASIGMLLFLKRCAACHGRHAWGDGPREIPALAGQRENYLIEQMERFAADERRGSPMHGRAMFTSMQPADVNRRQGMLNLAAYLTQAARNPEPDHGPGQGLREAKEAFNSRCATCHGDDGGGMPERVPAIGGQHYEYLSARLSFLAAAPKSHPGQLGPARGADLEALADYISRLSYLRASAPP